ncbi:MAG: glycine--tRNA ligase subunit beta [Betaproteobacteria bacterium]|nr:MAG: glycine--tRNA ligase subunit beta [Betaproteobacteria bacterium]
MEASLLVELLTEELPPKSLARLAESFANELFNGLVQHQLKLRDFAGRRVFATPRRIATLIPQVSPLAVDRSQPMDGPSVKAPAPAIEGFARKQGVTVEALQQRDTPKGRIYVANVVVKGAVLDSVLAQLVSESIKKLPIPKLMRWGAGEAQFVRPVHGLVMLHGARVVPGSVLGISACATTHGHRFMGARSIALAQADEYEARLFDDGAVIADFGKRRAEIDRLLLAEAARQGGSLGAYQDLLDEVTALVEHPSVYAGSFDPGFLEVPQECLILTMRQNQKYFPLFDATGKLLPKFLIVANMRLADPRHVIDGNQRVVRPRLEDARFFHNQDRKLRLEERVPRLARVVHHNKLGSQLERVERLQLLAGRIARDLGTDGALAERAAWLAKADLLTGMVGEFPELQGVMGRYYALHDGEAPEVADAIEAHYRPRHAGGALPEGVVACAVALADKLDTLAGLFGLGQQPTGDKDPFALRRAALGTIRILVERNLDLSLAELVSAAFAGYSSKLGDARTDLKMFVLDRMRGYFQEAGYSANEVDAVLAMHPARINLIPRQLVAVRAFAALPEAVSLAAANKRVANILKQAAAKGESFANAELSGLKEPAERALHEALRSTTDAAQSQFARGDYTAYLKTFAVLKAPVDAFFDSVLVMVDDEKLRHSRLALLADLRSAMNRVADISKLAQ